MTLRIDDDILMIQVDGTKQKVYMKLTTQQKAQDIVMQAMGTLEYTHDTGKRSQVSISMAGIGINKIRVANLTPELQNTIIHNALSRYGEIKGIQEDVWPRHYRYVVANGIRIVSMTLKQHIPSHITTGGHRALIEYEGQLTTCYGRNKTGHLYQQCPTRCRPQGIHETRDTSSAEMLTLGVTENRHTQGDVKMIKGQDEGETHESQVVREGQPPHNDKTNSEELQQSTANRVDRTPRKCDINKQ
jgi:hypothetical protein